MSGYLLYVAAQLLNLREVIFSIHNVNKDRRYLREGIEDVIAKRGDPDDTLRLLLRDIDNLEPLSGYGLFGVDRSTLTSMISVAITYLIILIQLEESHRDVPLLDALDEDEYLVPSRDTPGVGADSADF